MFKLIFGLLGGLALFIYGMQLMGEGLQNMAGKKMRRVLEVLTGVPVIGVLVGTAVTGVVQSSSLTTVMVVGFVNASLMTLKQGISVIMGANIGTTVTAQLVAFKITEYWYLLVALGFLAYFFMRKKHLKNTGFIFFSLGVLLLGMVLMGDAMKPLSSSEGFTRAMLMFSQYKVLGLLTGLVLTAIIQSSSASIGVLIAMAAQGLIPLDAALPILLGQNIGTCITAVLASVGTGLSARRAAAAHVIFNMLGAVAFMIALPLFQSAVLAISPAGDVPRQIANAHTFFNVICTMLCLPLINQFTRLVMRVVPGVEKELTRGPVYLDWHMVDSPPIAIDLALKEVLRMAALAGENVHMAVEGFLQGDAKQLQAMKDQEEVVDELEKEISRYLAKVAQAVMGETDSVRHTGLLHASNDIERVSDHADNIADLAFISIADGLRFSPMAIEEIKTMYALVEETYNLAVQALKEEQAELAAQVFAKEKIIDDMEKRLRQSHISRLKEGVCGPEAGVIFLDIISNFERVGDHANNLAHVSQGDMGA